MSIRNLGSLISDEIRAQFIADCLVQLPDGIKVLDVGCGKRPYMPLYQPKAQLMIGVDVPYSLIADQGLDVYADVQHLPFRKGSFNLVVCTEVLEHVPQPGHALNEIACVLDPEGYLILTTPFLVPEHDAPYDFYRYTSYGLRFLLEKQGFSIIHLAPKGDLLGVSVAAIVRYQLKLWHGIAKAMRIKFLATPLNPFVWLGVLLLQRVYLAYLRSATRNSSSVLGKLHQVLRYGCLGYVTLARRTERS